MKETDLRKNKFKDIIINNAVNEYKNTPLLDRSISGISKKYGINYKTLHKYLKLNHIEINHHQNGSSFRSDFFKHIDSEEKAYWLGFLYADGYVSSKGNAVGLGVALKDIEHLQKYNSSLHYRKGLKVSITHQFGDKNNTKNTNGDTLYMVRTIIKNQELRNNLVSKGCIPNKSLVLKFPNINIFEAPNLEKQRELIMHFIRGYFDGDGTLGLYKHSVKIPKLEESLMFVGTKSFLSEIQKYLGVGYLIQKKNCSQYTYRLSYSTKKAFIAAQLMYSNANLYLERKYNIYLKMCRNRIGQKR